MINKQITFAVHAFWSGDRFMENQQNRALKALGIEEKDFLKWRIDFWKNSYTGRGIDFNLYQWLLRIDNSGEIR